MKKNTLYTILLTFVLGWGATSCNDFLDSEPLSKISPEQYFTDASHLQAYADKLYSDILPSHGKGMGLFSDAGTDNQVARSAEDRYGTGYWRVPNEDDDNWNFSRIYKINFFFDQVLPKFGENLDGTQNTITGTLEDIQHYIGEMYFLRAWEYFKKLRLYGDFPIVKSTLVDDSGLLVDVSKRRPRNEVARFIIQDLDSAIMLMQPVFKNKNRLSSTIAQLVKSRVALYEASWLTYHRGTPFVPGGPDWPGATADYNNGFTIDLDSEIDYFLTQAMESAQEVADATQLTQNSGVMNPSTSIEGWNPYFEMFAAVDMSGYDEILFWRSYSQEMNVLHAVGPCLRVGNDYGLTKGYVDGFLMKNGLPWYAANSGYHGDKTIQDVKADRDERLQLFLVDPTNIVELATKMEKGAPNILGAQTEKEVTGYALRKCYNYDPLQSPLAGMVCSYGSIIFRAAEAYLNYIEACYMKNGSLDGKAQDYWRAIRERAGVDPDFNKTIQATDLSKENDWAVYSAGQPVDATLFNIRRERRNEFIGESMRWDDLRRWRALDQVKNYVIEGFNLWDEMYNDEEYKDAKTGKSLLIEPGGSELANVSSRNSSKYLRPYQIIEANNEVYNGYTWSKANYLTPIPAYEIMLTASQGDNGVVNLDSSPLYQNPYWPKTAGASAIE